MTAASAPPAAVIEGMEKLGFAITHVYGLTEVYGPAVVCAWHEEWDTLPAAEQATLKARQGVAYPVLEGLGLLNQDVARAEMAADPRLRQFARETYESLVREYAGAAKQALGHAEFLRLVNEMR